jgi:deoxyribose-phosphate aldolase
MVENGWSKPQLARIIDHTLLRPDATAADMERLCQEGLTYRFASVCIAPIHIARCVDMVKGSDVKVCSIVGFPLGNHCSKTKAHEADFAVSDGVHELDMVMNVGELVAGNYRAVEEDIKAVVAACGDSVLVKVIIEAGLLNDAQKREACRIIVNADADFVKSNTGFGYGGAAKEDIVLMRDVVGPRFGVKASGGIRTYEQAIELIHAGANRIGTSAGVSMVS